MKNLGFPALVLAAVLFTAPGAFALSTEQAPVNSDGTSKFADPDDQSPRGLVSPDSASPHASMNFSGSSSSVNLPSPAQSMGVDQGASAFDHAYDHLQNER